MVLVQKSPFFQLFSEVVQARKMSFTILQNKKTPFQAINTSGSKSRNIDIFPKVLTCGFAPKMAIFPPFFTQYRPGKCLLRYSRTKKPPFQAMKTRTSKNRKIDIFLLFWSKNGHFSNFFQAIQSWKMSFRIFQSEKTPFQAINTRSLKTRKIDIFPKGLTHGLGKRMPIFQLFSWALQSRKMCFTIFWKEKRLFWQYKQEVQRVEKLTFFQRG